MITKKNIFIFSLSFTLLLLSCDNKKLIEQQLGDMGYFISLPKDYEIYPNPFKPFNLNAFTCLQKKHYGCTINTSFLKGSINSKVELACKDSLFRKDSTIRIINKIEKLSISHCQNLYVLSTTVDHIDSINSLEMTATFMNEENIDDVISLFSTLRKSR